jgi:hypothetical protein
LEGEAGGGVSVIEDIDLIVHLREKVSHV